MSSGYQWRDKHTRTYNPFQGLHGHSGETEIPQPDDGIPRGRGRGPGRGTGRGQPPPPNTLEEPSFPQFPRLPLSVRLRIWEMTVEPRIVEVRVNYTQQDAEYDMVTAVGRKTFPEGVEVIPFFASTPVPAPLQVCREARKHLGTVCYQKAFHEVRLRGGRKAGEEEEVDGDDDEGPKITDEEQPEDEEPQQGNEEPNRENEESKPESNQQTPLPPASAHRPYIWMNSTHDLLSIGPSFFRYFTSYAPSITALRFQRQLPSDSDDEGANEVVTLEERAAILADLRLVSNFVNVKEIHVICSYGQDVQDWAGVETELGIKFPCGKQKVLVISPGDDLVVDAGEIDIYE